MEEVASTRFPHPLCTCDVTWQETYWGSVDAGPVMGHIFPHLLYDCNVTLQDMHWGSVDAGPVTGRFNASPVMGRPRQ